jgi:hypothetical protein
MSGHVWHVQFHWIGHTHSPQTPIPIVWLLVYIVVWTGPVIYGLPTVDHNFCKNKRNKEKPQATGVVTGLLRFLMGEPVMGREKPITVGN